MGLMESESLVFVDLDLQLQVLIIIASECPGARTHVACALILFVRRTGSFQQYFDECGGLLFVWPGGDVGKFASGHLISQI